MSVLLGTAVCVTSLPANINYQVVRRMSSPGLTSGAQLRYLLQWFGEFSELQREDFIPIMAAASQGQTDQLANILASLNCEDKPVSLFQCRVKLFNEWYPTWAEEEQHRLIKGICDMDPEFAVKYHDLITNGPKLNGDSNGSHTPDITEDKAEQSQTESDIIDEEKVETSNVEAEVVSEPIIPVEIAAAS